MSRISLLEAVAYLNSLKSSITVQPLTKWIGFNTQPLTGLHFNTTNVPGTMVHPYRVGMLLESEGSSVGARIGLRTANNGGEQPYLSFYRSRGTLSDPAPVIAGDGLGSIFCSAHDGSGHAPGGSVCSMLWVAAQDWSPTAHGTHLDIALVKNDTAANYQVARFDQAGSFLMGTLQNPVSDFYQSVPRAHFFNRDDIAVRQTRDTRDPNVGIGGTSFAGLDINGNVRDVGLIRGLTQEEDSISGGVQIFNRMKASLQLEEAVLFSNIGRTSFYEALQRSRVNINGGLTTFVGEPSNLAHSDKGLWVLKNDVEFAGFAWQLGTVNSNNTASAELLIGDNAGSWRRVLSAQAAGKLLVGGVPGATAIGDLHINQIDGDVSGSLSLTGGGGASYILMGNRDSNGTAGPAIIAAANREIEFGFGNDFNQRSGGTISRTMKITQTQVHIGTNQGWGGVNARLNINYTGAGALYGITLRTNSSALSRPISFIRGGNDDGTGTATEIGYIGADTTRVYYNETSDSRVKQGIVPMNEVGDIIDKFNMVEYAMKAEPTKRLRGAIAQELISVYPEAVTRGDDEEQVKRVWAIDWSKVVPITVRELQSLRRRVATVEADNALLRQENEYFKSTIQDLLARVMKLETK